MSEDKAWNTGHKLSQEHQGQKHGVLQETYKDKQSHRVTCERNTSWRLTAHFTDQFEHPRVAAARSEAAEQSENNDDGSGPDEDIWCIGALLRRQREIGLQAHLPPHPDRQQDHACELKKTAGRVRGRASKSLRERRAGFVRVVSLTQDPRLKARTHRVNYTLPRLEFRSIVSNQKPFESEFAFNNLKKKSNLMFKKSNKKKNFKSRKKITKVLFRFVGLGFNKYGYFYRLGAGSKLKTLSSQAQIPDNFLLSAS